MQTSVTIIAICLGSMLAGGAAAVARRTAMQQPREGLPQPAGWVAFSSKVTVQRGGVQPVIGSFYRSSNGSTRLETGPSGNDIRVVSIKHVPSRTSYVRGTDSKWVSKPMDPHSVEFEPLRFHAGMPLLAPYPKKINIIKGEPYSLSSESGFSAYQLMSSNGGMLLLVPELNFFPVVQERLDGRREVYTDVSLGEPDGALFLPPPGATVDVLTGHRPSSRPAP